MDRMQSSRARRPSIVAAVAVIALHAAGASAETGVVRHNDYDVVIAGGTTAALAAAITAHDEGARVALLEPTDWVGGQLTASGVPAVDEAWHKAIDPETGEVLVDVAAVARDPRNMTPLFRDMLLAIGNPGRGWVSRFCFEPRDLLENHLEPLLAARSERLHVYLNTVVKSVQLGADGRRIAGLTAIRRTPRPGVQAGGYDVLPSDDLPDWYAAEDSPRFTKQVHQFAAADDERATVFIDATEWGELLVLADAPYRVGVESSETSPECNEQCGQATVYGFVQELHAEATEDWAPAPAVDHLGFGSYMDRPDAWAQIWTYRRLRGSAPEPRPGDLSLQNWGYSSRLGHGGNDYPFGYLLLDRAASAAQRGDWQGGVDRDVMAAAEQRAYGWHQWFKAHAPEGIDPRQITLSRTVLGAAHGLSKLPYIRDTRRSVGVDGFVLKYDDLAPPLRNGTGTKFADRVALGAYPGDVHPLAGCDYPEHVHELETTLPFYIPLRALTNEGVDNLLVAGKTMAQTFLANSATRLHPIEWSSGTAAGVAAAMMGRDAGSSRELLEQTGNVQRRVRNYTPIDYQTGGQADGARP